MLHALDRRYGLPVTWPGYYVAKASALLRAAELVKKPFGEGSLRAKVDDKQSGSPVREQKLTVARPLILRITIPGAFLALNCENQPTLLALDNANLWPLIVRICEQATRTAKLSQGRPIR
jgi:hypothetical protein